MDQYINTPYREKFKTCLNNRDVDFMMRKILNYKKDNFEAINPMETIDDICTNPY